METAPRFDARLAPLTQHVKSMAEPQTLFAQKAGDVRADRGDGIVTLYRYEDIVKINRHPAVLGTGGRGSSFGNDNALIRWRSMARSTRSGVACWTRCLLPSRSPSWSRRCEIVPGR
jgi:hypothetical protein